MDQQFLEDIGTVHHCMKQIMKPSHIGHEMYGLNKTQAHVLALVARHSENTMTQISQEIGLMKGSFTTVVDSLIEKGYLERVRSELDRQH